MVELSMAKAPSPISAARAGMSESIEKSEGLKDAFKGHPGMKWIGQDPYEVTNWDPSQMAKVISAPDREVSEDRRHIRRPLGVRS